MENRKSTLDAKRKHDVLNRLKSARGHLDGIVKMIEDDTYCVGVIKQIAAVRAVLDRVSRIVYPAFGILLSPVVAALAMSFSSVSVIANALRLRSLRLVA